MDTMIILYGVWICFHCGSEYPNRILICGNCNASRKHSENMRKSLGMDTSPCIIPLEKGEDMANRRKIKVRYDENKTKFEGFISRFFRYALKIRVFKDREGIIKQAEDTLYYGFDNDGFHYTVRRDKI